MADQKLTERKELENQIRELTRDKYVGEKGLIKKIAEEIPSEKLRFIELVEVAADDLSICVGVFYDSK